MYIYTHLCLKYTKESLIQNVHDKEILKFMQKGSYDDFADLYEMKRFISEMKTENLSFTKTN